MAKVSRRDRLRSRPRPSVPYRFQIDDVTEPAKALIEAELALRMAQARGADAAEIADLRKKQESAQKKFDACYEVIEITAMKPSDFEALIAEHPAREGTDDSSWNDDTFPRACFLACAPDDLSADEWDEFLSENCSDGEIGQLYQMALVINVRAPEKSVPKGLMRTQD